MQKISACDEVQKKKLFMKIKKTQSLNKNKNSDPTCK